MYKRLQNSPTQHLIFFAKVIEKPIWARITAKVQNKQLTLKLNKLLSGILSYVRIIEKEREIYKIAATILFFDWESLLFEKHYQCGINSDTQNRPPTGDSISKPPICLNLPMFLFLCRGKTSVLYVCFPHYRWNRLF